MITFEVAKEIERQKSIYNNFFMPTIIVNKNLSFFWGNLALLKDPALRHAGVDNIKNLNKDNLTEMVEKLTSAKSVLLEQVYSKGDDIYDAEIISMQVNQQLEGYIVVLLKQSSQFSGNMSINDDMIMNISNDIRQSVSKIFEANDSLIKKSTEEFKEKNLSFLEKINMASYKILRLSNNLNTYIELNNGRELELELVNLVDIAKNIDEILVQLLKDTNIEFELKVQSSSLLAQVDVTLIEMALCNLIHNAVYYSKGANKITLSLAKHNDDVIIEITDKGDGFDNNSDSFSSVFKPEAGIGLKLADKIIVAHGGKLNFNGAFTGGTKIGMNFPTNTLTGIVSFASVSETKQLPNKYSNIYVGLVSAMETPYIAK